MQLLKKIIKLKKNATFFNIILINRDIQNWDRGPQCQAKGPPQIFKTVHNLGVLKKMKVGQEEILSSFIL